MKLFLDVISPGQALLRSPWTPIVLVVIVVAVVVAVIERKRRKK